jgi:O-antigen/teichoic acid export membrane protein
LADMAGAPEPISKTRKIDTKGLAMRVFAARGVVINTAFEVGFSGLGLIQGFVLAGLLSTGDYGIWGILMASLGVLAQLKIVGIGDKYLQQDEADQELEFQKAFTLEILMTMSTCVILVAAVPLLALIYHQSRLLAPGLVVVVVVAAGVLQTPFWRYYRDMDFFKQRIMTGVQPVVSFVIAITLALLGFGYWSLVLSTLVGTLLAGAIAIKTALYPFKWRYDRGTLKLYSGYSIPIFLAMVSAIGLSYTATIAANAHLGLAAVGVIALSFNIITFAQRVDQLVSGTLYPAICAVQTRIDLLRESFVKSNRLALMWAMPFGCGLTLFGADLIHFVLGNKWDAAISFLEITGLVEAIGHIGFNWDDYLRARAITRPIAISGFASWATFALVGIPLMFPLGLKGLAIGIGAQALTALAIRAYYMTILFEGFQFVSHAMRAMLPTLPAVAVVLLARQFEHGHRTALIALCELVAYGIVTLVATLWFERPLVLEVIGYLRGMGGGDAGTPAATVPVVPA